MAMPRREVDFDKIYESNFTGKFKILEEVEPLRYGTTTQRMVRVKFLATGYETTARLTSVINGNVKDPYFPTVAGVGYFGEINKGSVPKVIYDIWYHMIKRCYDPNSALYKNGGALGVTVDPRWFSFANFVQDLPKLPGYTKFINNPDLIFNLDRHALQQGIPENQKIYSVNTCALIPQEENSHLSGVSKHTKGCSSEYYGLYRTPYNTFQCRVMIDGVSYFLGTYKDEIAAANVYNYVASKCLLIAPLNDVPPMPITEALQYYSGTKPITLPPTMPNIDKYVFYNSCKCSSMYTGVIQRKDSFGYGVSYHQDHMKYNLGTYKTEIAAANMYNIFYKIKHPNTTSLPNNVEPMSIGQVMEQRNYANGKQPKEMCRIVRKDV